MFGLISLESGKLLASFTTEEAALDAVREVLRAEPDATGSVAVVSFDERGHPQHSLEGDELQSALEAVAA